MPRKSKRPCSHPDCPNLTEDKYCEEHKSLHPDRPSAAKRGYGSKWQRVSKAYLRRHPLCVRCKAQGRFTAATVMFNNCYKLTTLDLSNFDTKNVTDMSGMFCVSYFYQILNFHI